MNIVNIWAIIVSAIVAFAIGAAWYSPILFGKEWMALTKVSGKDMAPGQAKGMWKLYVGSLIMSLISFGVLGFLISMAASRNAGDGAFLGFLVWLGFVAPIGVSSLSWEQKPFKLVLINTVNILLTLVIGGAILAAWR